MITSFPALIAAEHRKKGFQWHGVVFCGPLRKCERIRCESDRVGCRLMDAPHATDERRELKSDNVPHSAARARPSVGHAQDRLPVGRRYRERSKGRTCTSQDEETVGGGYTDVQRAPRGQLAWTRAPVPRSWHAERQGTQVRRGKARDTSVVGHFGTAFTRLPSRHTYPSHQPLYEKYPTRRPRGTSSTFMYPYNALQIGNHKLRCRARHQGRVPSRQAAQMTFTQERNATRIG